jgi:2',3'-cyclic-nucleotide 2'-phosphodiesterase (5'-nucleotidase family)
MKTGNIIFAFISAAMLFISSCSDTGAVKVYSVSSLNGNIFPSEKDSLKTGGFSLISSAIKKDAGRISTSPVIIGNSNFIYGTKEAYFTSGRAVIELMNELNFSCLIIGHREFYFGFDELKELSKTAKFPFLSANITYKDSCEVEFIHPYLILNDRTSAVIGISTAKVLKTNLEKDVRKISVSDPAEAAARYIKELKTKGVKTIMIAGDFDCDESSNSNLTPDEVRRLFALEDVALFLTTTEKAKFCPLSKTRPVLNCGINGAEAASFMIKNGSISGGKKIPVNSSELSPDPELSKKMAEISQMIMTIGGKIIGNASAGIPHAKGDNFNTETALGNLVCDIMRDYTGTDIFLMNSGKVRKGFEKGPVTLGDLYNVIPYEGSIVTVKMTGEQIIGILESSCAFKMSKSFLQVSGINFTFDSSKKPLRRVDEKSIKVGGKSLDKNGVYSVSLTDYIYQGGDSYSEFGDMGIKLELVHDKQMREILKDFIMRSETLRMPENNRITDITKL